MRDNGTKDVVLKYLAVLVVISFYLYPTLRTRVELGPMPLAPVFAPDLSMYLNLSEMPAAGEGRILNPYYRIPVPANGSGYLKFRVAPGYSGPSTTVFTIISGSLFWSGTYFVGRCSAEWHCGSLNISCPDLLVPSRLSAWVC